MSLAEGLPFGSGPLEVGFGYDIEPKGFVEPVLFVG